MSKPNGVILYRGPGLLDRRLIVVIATGLRAASENAKTGQMIQTFVLSDEGLSPVQAILAGRDASVCGDCPMRATYGDDGAYIKAGACYVNVGQAANAVWEALQRGAYPSYSGRLHRALFAGRLVRFGTYGDPAAVPARVWRRLARLASGRTGYTHQWRTAPRQLRRYLMASVETPAQAAEAQAAGWRTFRVRLASGRTGYSHQWRNLGAAFKRLVMASVDTPEDAAEAQAAGWRTFRVRRADEPLLPSEIMCPASAEAGKRRTCATCRACSGATGSAAARSVAIIVHGLAWKVQRYEQMRGRIEETRRGPLAMVS